MPVIKVCRSLGVSRQALYKRRDADHDFAAAWDEALEDGRQTLIADFEDEMDRRAKKGIPYGSFTLKSVEYPKVR